LSLSVLSLPTPHAEPLSDSALSSLFGNGDDARRTLINYWLDDARIRMKSDAVTESPSMKNVLRKRLERNQEVLEYLPEVI
jgi:ubiquinone biosynthesis protein COQ9